MVGNKYKADHLARSFKERLSSLNKIKSDLNKVASEQAAPKKKMKAEDFLISGKKSEKKSPASAAIDSEIEKTKQVS